MKLEEFNGLDESGAVDVLKKVCGASKWVAGMLENRPFGSVEKMKERALEVWNNCSETDWKEAFSHHPKIGDLKSLEKKFSNIKEWAEKEQASVKVADSKVLQELAKGNKAYEVKYGYIFIVCATGKSAKEMLDLLKERIHNPPKTEILIAKDEEAKITALRIDKLLNGAT